MKIIFFIKKTCVASLMFCQKMENFQAFLKTSMISIKADYCDNRKPYLNWKGVQILLPHPVETWFCIKLAKVEKS